MKEVKNLSSQIFNQINKTNSTNPDDLEVLRLSGISNQTFKISINSSTEINNKESCEFAYKSLIYKIFGRINSLVDRDLEMSLIKEFSSKKIGPNVYSTDNKTFRIEEYLENTRNITHSEIFEEVYLSQIIDRFLCINQVSDKNYFSYLGFQDKYQGFKQLANEKTTNIFNFSNGMRDLAQISIENFEKEIQNDMNFFTPEEYNNLTKDISFIKSKVDASIEEIIQLSPSNWIFTINHNDAHPCNIIVNEDKLVYLIDLEYGGYNFLGFDIANFLLESIFTLDHFEFPFWKQFEGYNKYDSKKYLDIWRQYINKYFEINKSYLEEELNKRNINLSIKELMQEYLQERTYRNIMAISSIYWFLYAVLYINYKEFKEKSNFDYFSYSIKRYSIKDYLDIESYGI